LASIAISGTRDLHIDQEIDQPEIAIEANLSKTQQFGLKPGDVRRTAATLIGGLQTGSLFDEQKIFPVVVWGTANVRNSINSMSNILIDTPSGKWVRLGDVANISIKPTPNFIQHDTVSRSIDVGLNVQGRNATAVINEIKDKLATNIVFPLEYRAQVIGLYQQQQYQTERLLLISLAAILLIFLLLQAVFNNFCLAALVLFTLPLALLGSLIVGWCIGFSSNLSLIALLAILAIAIRNTLASVSTYQTVSQADTTNTEVLYTAASARFTLILITHISLILALIPFLFMYCAPGLEMIAPLSALMIGGLITSMLYSGVIIPLIYLGFSSCDQLPRS
jgi:Cu/Ag efflux pump CusA